MELVVRLSRHMHEKGLPFKVAYAFNANCWTEVPEDMNTLRRQRDRWHRGLIEILLYHRKCAFNPRYGTMGLIAFPYFFIFEVVGPFFELFGWLTIPLAVIFGILNGPLS
jgi:cellulose synthase/poly-beta-1,6-N-acetylglucosamine synthase-like glycosyltransferase